jgi:hypothetical protein
MVRAGFFLIASSAHNILPVDKPGSYLDDSTVANEAVVAHSSDPVSAQRSYESRSVSSPLYLLADQRRQIVDVDGEDHRRGVHILDDSRRTKYSRAKLMCTTFNPNRVLQYCVQNFGVKLFIH